MAAEYLSTSEAVRSPGVSRAAVTLMVQTGRVPAIRASRGWVVPREALLAFASDYQKGAGDRKPKNATGGGKP